MATLSDIIKQEFINAQININNTSVDIDLIPGQVKIECYLFEDNIECSATRYLSARDLRSMRKLDLTRLAKEMISEIKIEYRRTMYGHRMLGQFKNPTLGKDRDNLTNPVLLNER